MISYRVSMSLIAMASLWATIEEVQNVNSGGGLCGLSCLQQVLGNHDIHVTTYDLANELPGSDLSRSCTMLQLRNLARIRTNQCIVVRTENPKQTPIWKSPYIARLKPTNFVPQGHFIVVDKSSAFPPTAWDPNYPERRVPLECYEGKLSGEFLLMGSGEIDPKIIVASSSTTNYVPYGISAVGWLILYSAVRKTLWP